MTSFPHLAPVVALLGSNPLTPKISCHVRHGMVRPRRNLRNKEGSPFWVKGACRGTSTHKKRKSGPSLGPRWFRGVKSLKGCKGLRVQGFKGLGLYSCQPQTWGLLAEPPRTETLPREPNTVPQGLIHCLCPYLTLRTRLPYPQKQLRRICDQRVPLKSHGREVVYRQHVTQRPLNLQTYFDQVVLNPKP